MKSQQVDNGVSLKSKAVKGGFVTLTAQMVTVAVQLASIVILSRLLPPEDFGIIAMLAVMMLVRDMSRSIASIQRSHQEHGQIGLRLFLKTDRDRVPSLLELAP